MWHNLVKATYASPSGRTVPARRSLPPAEGSLLSFQVSTVNLTINSLVWRAIIISSFSIQRKACRRHNNTSVLYQICLYSIRRLTQEHSTIGIKMVGAGNFFSALLALGSGDPSQNPLGNDEHQVSTGPRTGNILYTLPTERTFLLNVPEAYTNDEPLPLVLSFHGGKI